MSVPTNGVYAIKATVKGEAYKGVMNIGVKPTFDNRGIKTFIRSSFI